MQKINYLLKKAKEEFDKRYEVPTELGKWDYAMMGMAAGAVLVNIGSVVLAVLISLFVIHNAWERKDV